MTNSSHESPENGALQAAVERRREQRERGIREGERSISRNLGLLGALGWTMVAPILLGILLGRWLDHRFDSGFFWTLGLLFAGVFAGCVMAWKRMQRE